jgi:hypothetical protein
MPESVDFLTVEYPDGRTRTLFTRLTDGRVMCQLCFGYFAVDDLNPVEGCVEDVCQPCAASEAEAVNRSTNEEPDHA